MDTGLAEEAAAAGGGGMLVPWPSWDQWNLVRESLFSSSPDSVASALDRIRGWRSRGCVPVAVQVTAAIVEIQQKDPFFREELVGKGAYSEEMLSMLYSMAITRLVNGFVHKVRGYNNHAQKHALGKAKQSISMLADALGVPRVLVDIRHESSHSELPSLPVLRLAISKALDWLNHNYWEPQKRAIPDIRKEVRCRLRRMVSYLKTKHVERSNSLQGKVRHPQQQISKISKIIARWYSISPMKVTLSLLEFYMSPTPNISTNIEIEDSSVSNPENSESFGNTENDLKAVIMELSRKSPGLLLMLLKAALQKIEAKEAMELSDSCPTSLGRTNSQEIEHLSFLVQWLLIGVRDLKKSGRIKFIDATQTLSSGPNAIPTVSLMELLRTCALLSASGNKRLSDAALFVAQMTANQSLSAKLKRLPVLGKEIAPTIKNWDLHDYDPLLDKHSLTKAKLEFAALRSRLKENAKYVTSQSGKQEGKKRWTLSKTWSPCPIGMLPCFLSSAAFLPMLDTNCGSHQKMDKVDNGESGNSNLRKREGSHSSGLMENPGAQKKQRALMPDNTPMDVDKDLVTSMKGMLLVNGDWRKVGEEELQAIGSNVRIIVK